MRPLPVTIAIGLAFVSLVTAENPSLKPWFVSSMQGSKKPVENADIPLADIAKLRGQVFEAYKQAAVEKVLEKEFALPNELPKEVQGKLEIQRRSYHIAEGLDMPYVALQKGEKPPDGWPLFIAMHGGGSTGDKLSNPHAWPHNNQEWNVQIKLAISLYPANAIYFIPRMVDDNRGRWWKEFNYTAFSAMIRHAILFWDVDPNRVYMLGISEGGYGSETLACRYPDKFAAANGMACGSGTSIHVENLRNLPFRTDVGEKDTMFGRFTNAVKKHELLRSLQSKDPEGYIHELAVQAGLGHGIDYKRGPEWLMGNTRKPQPKRVTYTLFHHDGVKNKGAYWLQANNDLEKKVVFLDGQIITEENSINITAVATKNDEKVQVADAQQALADAGETIPATGLVLRIWVHEALLDFGKPIKISINGKLIQTMTPKAELSSMCESLMLFGDPNYTYPSKVDVMVP